MSLLRPDRAAPAGTGLNRGACPRLAVLAGAVAGACAARGAYTLLRWRPPGGEQAWARTNHRGEPVTLLEGPALAVGAVAGEAVTAALAGRAALQPATVAGLGALGFGIIDDLNGSGQRRGLRGHLGALAHGEVTTGTVKLAGLAVTGLGAAWLDGAGPVDLAVNAGLIAGGANLLNLFDLRPGRAIKVAALSASLIAAGGGTRSAGRLAALAAVAAPAGAALALLPDDLAERAMLGDGGANALGALLGAAAARSLPRPARAGLLAGVVALTVASERVSFTRVIASTPPLHWLDMLGRRPAPRAAPAQGGAGGTPWGRRPGRHRRAAARESCSRSVAWVCAWLKTPAPPGQ